MTDSVACFLGVDLGSTMSKAVLVDAGEQLLGSAACSTRGRHTDAIARAQAAALEDARLTLLGRALIAEAHDATAAAGLRARVQHALHRRTHQRDVARLHHTPALQAATGPLREALHEGLERLAGLAPGPPGMLRELVAGPLVDALELLAERRRIPAESLISILERAACAVDSEPPPPPSGKELSAAVEDLAAGGELAGADLDAARRAADRAAGETLHIVARTGTGYGRHMLPFDAAELRSEILCHALGAHRLFPATRTVLDVGGQDTKAIHVDEQGRVLSFQMNDRCAAGCGRFLGYVADELGLSPDELAALSSPHRSVPVSATCTVFAGAEVRELLAAGTPLPEVLAGLHEAVAERAIGLLARAGEVRDAVTFTGGVSRNGAVVAALRRLLPAHLGARTLNVAPETIFAGALGAALFARRGAAEAR